MQSKLRWRSYKMFSQGFYYPSDLAQVGVPNGGRQNRDKMIVVQMDLAGPTVTGFISDV